MTTIIEQNRDRLIELCRKYHVAALDVFGSAACEDFDERCSDVDLLVETKIALLLKHAKELLLQI